MTRVETKKLQIAVLKASNHLDEAVKALKPFFVVLTDKERAATLRPPNTFLDAGRTLARSAVSHPEIAAVSEFDAEAVVEDLDNVAVLTPIVERMTEITRLLADTRLTWLAEAWVPSLALYSIAKVRAKSNGALRTVFEPLAAVFATRRARPAKTEP